MLTSSVLSSNSPDHERMRRLVSGSFTARRVTSLAGIVEQLCARMIEALGSRVDSGEPVDPTGPATRSWTTSWTCAPVSGGTRTIA